MKSLKHSRQRAPLTVAVGGTIIAVAVGIGHGWSDALIAEVVTLCVAAGYYLLTGSNGDVGAIYGNRADERQRIVYWRASALALRVMLLSAFVCAVITVAMKDNYWQADVIGSVGGASFLLGLAGYGASDERSLEEDYDERSSNHESSSKGVME
jgi:hypothetical protein